MPLFSEAAYLSYLKLTYVNQNNNVLTHDFFYKHCKINLLWTMDIILNRYIGTGCYTHQVWTLNTCVDNHPD